MRPLPRQLLKSGDYTHGEVADWVNECYRDFSPIKSLRQWVPGQLFADILTLIARLPARYPHRRGKRAKLMP
jgi:hypothetical protein